MQSTDSDVFALQDSGLGAFLYAEVGAEANGSTLTILSVLARLGKDPWAQAARWAALPKSAVIDSLAESIAEMPLTPSAIAGARESATRLVKLLPGSTHGVFPDSAAASARATSNLPPPRIVYLALAAAAALGLLLIAIHSSSVPAASGAPSGASTETGSPAPAAASPVMPDRQ